MTKHECPKCGWRTTQPLPNTTVAHPCPRRRQGDRYLVTLKRIDATAVASARNLVGVR